MEGGGRERGWRVEEGEWKERRGEERRGEERRGREGMGVEEKMDRGWDGAEEGGLE